jgi:glycosyltransferase involved in cell wall biosynthesis
LLSPDKGIEFMIGAMPRILLEHPNANYVVVGATHPKVRVNLGEAYRESLQALARALGVGASVKFVDRFVSREELIAYLAAMDIYVTPYLNPAQVTSGTLAYAIGAGKAVISTPYWYAQELLADGRGLLVRFRDSEAIASAVLAIQSDPEARKEMGRRAAELGKQMRWPTVGRQYLCSFEKAIKQSKKRYPMPAEWAATFYGSHSAPAGVSIRSPGIAAIAAAHHIAERVGGPDGGQAR